MWKIKEIKKQSKKIIKNNIWTLIFVGFIMSFILGEYKSNKNGISNIKNITEILIRQTRGEEIRLLEGNDGEISINKYIDSIISQILFGTADGTIKNLNEKHNVTKGTFYVIFNTITNGQTQLQKFVNSITDYSTKLKIAEFLIIITTFLGLLIKIFLTNPIVVGESRIFLESKNYKKTKFKRILYPYRKGRYWNCVKTILLRNIYKDLWNLTIIGGIIKEYSYKMVPFIIAENTNIKPNDAIKMSREMMNGNKLKTFYMDLSFLGWHILEYITFGLAGIYVTPYVKASYTQLYTILRKEYIQNKKMQYEALNDENLYENHGLLQYPDKYNKKIKIDYSKNYEITSIILFFFTFSFVGWLWEVGLYLFRDGILVNRGSLYGPWLPIYGTGCTTIILLTKFKIIRKMLKNPLLTFNVNMIICSIIEYLTSWYIEMTKGIKYWDYTGTFMNINGRICLECALFFGFGSCICVYFVAPFLEKQFQKVTTKVKITVCLLLAMIFTVDTVYSTKYPHKGEGITIEYSKSNNIMIN